MARLTDRTAIVLAGGYATRFGAGDKALAELDKKPLIRHVTDTLVDVVDELVVNCRRAQQVAIASVFSDASYDPVFAIDPVPDRGPVAGLRTALQQTSADLAFVTACDMPGLEAGFVDELFDIATQASGAVPVFDDSRQPLAAVYRATPTEHACSRVLDDGSGSLRDVIDVIDPVSIDEARVLQIAPPGAFQNVNTRDDLAAALDAASD